MIEDDEGLPVSDETADIDIKDLTVGEQIGAGSYGMVYKGTCFGTEVAIKQIQNGVHQKELVKYLKREVAVLKNIKHPNIVQFLGVYYDIKNDSNNIMDTNSTWIVTEYIPSGDLHKRIKDFNQPFPFSLRIKLALDIALAMAYLHSRDIIFRDLKSKNILIDDSATPIRGKVCDFGFARIVKNKNRHLSICGTDDFMAPEVILGMEYDESADIFSFGILLLELSIRKKVSKALERGPHNAFELDEDQTRQVIPDTVPPLFTELIIDCIKYNPEERPKFPHIIHILKQLASLYPIPLQTLDNPLSPAGSPSIPRKNSMNSPFSKVMRLNSFDLKLDGIHNSIAARSKSNLSYNQNASDLEKENDLNNSINSNNSSNNNNNDENITDNNCNNSNNDNNNNNNDNHEDLLDLEEKERLEKVHYLKDKMTSVLKDLEGYIVKMGKDLLQIENEEQISAKYDECRKVIEIKKVLGEVIEGDLPPPTTPRKGSVNTRVAVFLKSMDRSLLEIHTSLDLLLLKINIEDNLVESLSLARVVSKLKKICLSQLTLNDNN